MIYLRARNVQQPLFSFFSVFSRELEKERHTSRNFPCDSLSSAAKINTARYTQLLCVCVYMRGGWKKRIVKERERTKIPLLYSLFPFFFSSFSCVYTLLDAVNLLPLCCCAPGIVYVC